MAGVVEGLTADIASEASKSLFTVAKRHAGYCFHFRNYVEDFETELKNLESTQNDALERQRMARENNEEITNVALNWLGKTNNLINVAKKIKDKAEEHNNCAIWWCPNCIYGYGLGKKAAKMIPELDRHNENFKSDNFSHPAPRMGMEFYAPIHFVGLESRREVYDKVWKALQDDKKLRVGVYGMGGLGKTTLVMELGNRAEKEKLFEKVVFVVVSNPPNVRTIQENIASQLGLEFKNNHESDRARELWSRLTNGEKILIILDDVWEKLYFNVIGIPFEDRHKDCRILLTTRNVDVCTSMDFQSKIKLSILSMEDSWKLFQKYANISNNPSIPLEVAKKIACECKGLPVAIATVASTLKDSEPQEWEYALTTLENVEPLIGIDDHVIKIYHCLRFSYANLKSREVQELFLLCSFFPQDYEIPVEVLTRYAIGLRLFGDDRSFTKARGLALKAKNTLVDSCLLLNVESNKGEYVKMHDLVHNVAQWVANKEIKEIMGSKIDEDSWDGARYLWYRVTTDLPIQLNYPRLKNLLISIETRSIHNFFEEEEIFKGLDNLCILTLIVQHVYLTLSFKLPRSIQELRSLRILRLKRLNLSDISVIESLKGLEILELCNCDIDELPTGIVELKSLKLFEFSDCKILQNRPPEIIVIGRLAQLEELYYSMQPSRGSVMIDGNNISDFIPENCQWSKLRRYRIQIGNKHLDDVLDDVDGLIATCLSIECFHPSTSNETIKDVVRRAEYIFLDKIVGDCKNIVPDVVGAVGGKIRWNNMYLHSCEDIVCLIDSTNVSYEAASMLSALVLLKVEHMDGLKELCHGRPPFSIFEKLRRLCLLSCAQLHGILFVGNLNFRNLKFVVMDNCPVLTSLFTLSVALSLELLEELSITHCAGLEHVIADEREWEKEDFNQKISSGSCFGKLKIVTVNTCDSLKFIFPISLAGRFTQLEKIQIDWADELKHIFGLYQDEGEPWHESDKEIMLPSLQELELWMVPSFVSIFPMYTHPNDCPAVEASDLEATTPMELHSSKSHATTWYTSSVQCLPRKLANLCHNRYGSQVEATALDATTSKELHASQNTNTRLPPHLSAVQYCLSRHLNMCNVREMFLMELSTRVVSLFTLSNAQRMLVKKLRIWYCDGLKHVITNGEVDFDQKSRVSIFPELQVFDVKYCNLLEFILSAGSAQCPAKLESLKIEAASKLKSVFGQCYHDNNLSHQNENKINTGLRPLRKSTDDFMICSDVREPDCITTEAILSHDNMLNIKNLDFRGSGVECVFMMEGLVVNEQQDQLISRLEVLTLNELHELRYICMGPQQCLSFQNLRDVKVSDCGKLRFLFSVSILRSLPQLGELCIENCNELEQIVEDDHILFLSQNVCFPNLTQISMLRCNKLKYLFFISQSNHFPKLKFLNIRYSSQLEEVFRWRKDETQNRNITLLPELMNVRLRELPCLTNVYQEFNLETVGTRDVKNCPKLSPKDRNKGEALAPLHSPITVMEQQCMEAKQEEAEHEESHMELEVVQTTTSLTTIADLDTVESNTIDRKESTEAAPQTSSHFPSGTSSDAPKELYPSVAPQDSSNNPLVVPPSSNLPSGTSGDAKKESSREEANGEEVIIDQFIASGKSRDAASQSSKVQAINMNENIHGSKSVDLDDEGVSASPGGELSKSIASPHFENIDQSEHDPSYEAGNVVAASGATCTIIEEGIVEHDPVINDHPMANVNPPDAPPPFHSVMPHDLASLVNNSAEDVELVSAFLAAHSDMVFPYATLPSFYRQSSYQTLIMLLKLLRSHSTLELIYLKKNVLIELLAALKCYGFSGPWLESLLNKLQGPHSLLAPEELHELIRTEESYSSQQSSLKKHIDELNAQLVDVEAKLKEISVKKKTHEDACVDLESYFHF